jgi:hypothetical protein
MSMYSKKKMTMHTQEQMKTIQKLNNFALSIQICEP